MKLLAVFCICFLLLSCSDNNQMSLPESDVIAVVGDEKVTLDLFKAFLIANGLNNPDDATKKLALETLISEVAMSNISLKKKLPLTTEQLNTFKYLQIRSQAKNAQLDYLANHEVTDEEIQKEYNKANKQTNGLEFYVHHLLFKDEVEALKNLDKIHNAEGYLAQEQQYLKTNTNMKNVGELGWVSLSQLPPAFKDKLLLTEKGTVVSEVVNSRYGAHIVYLKDTRPLQPPPLDQVKQGIIKSLSGQKVENFKQLAKAKAHVLIKE